MPVVRASVDAAEGPSRSSVKKTVASFGENPSL